MGFVISCGETFGGFASAADWSHAYISGWLKYFCAPTFPELRANQRRLIKDRLQTCAVNHGELF